GGGPAGVEPSRGVSRPPGARARSRDLLGRVLSGRSRRERGGPRDLRRRRGGGGALGAGGGRERRVPPDALPLGASAGDGVRVPGRPAAGRALEGGAPYRGRDDAGDGGGA